MSGDQYRTLRLALLAAGACAIGCVERKLTVSTRPEGSLAYLNAQEVGRTPVTRNFTWYGDYDVRLRQEGYQTLATHRTVVAPWWQWPPIDLVAEVLPFWFTDRQEITFDLQPASPEPVAPDVMLARAEAMRGELRSSEFTRTPSTAPSTAPTTQPSTQP